MDAVEKAIYIPKGTLLLMDGKVIITKKDGGEKELDERCQELKLGVNADPEKRKMVGADCEMDDKMRAAVNALPKPPKIFTLFYNTDEVTPTADSNTDLEVLAGQIEQDILNRQHHEVTVIGHADRQGSENYNCR